VISSEGLGEIVERSLAKGAKVFIEGALRTRKWQDQSGADRCSTEIHLTQYTGTMTFLDARKDDARSSEQNATRERANSGDGMTPKSTTRCHSRRPQRGASRTRQPQQGRPQRY
jgi:single-strand DNA-binding protein